MMERFATWMPSKRPQHTKTTHEGSFVTHQGLHLSLEVVLSFGVCVQVRDACVPRFPVFVALASAQQRRQPPCPAVELVVYRHTFSEKSMAHEGDDVRGAGRVHSRVDDLSDTLDQRSTIRS